MIKGRGIAEVDEIFVSLAVVLRQKSYWILSAMQCNAMPHLYFLLSKPSSYFVDFHSIHPTPTSSQTYT